MNVPRGASGSTHVRAKLFVPAGGSLQASGGEELLPWPVYWIGIGSSLANAELVRSSFMARLPTQIDRETDDLHHFPDFVLEDGRDDLAAIGRAANERLAELIRLLDGRLRRHRRLEWIDISLDNHWPRRGPRLVEHRAAFAGLFDGQASAAASASKRGEINRLQIAAEFRIAQKHHLFPFDLTKRVVLDDHDLDGQAILHGRDKLGHQHREAAIADERNARAVWISDLRRDRVGKSESHRGERAGAGMQLAALHRNVPRPPGSDRARVA